MFENILGQPQVVEALKRDIQQGTLPWSLLFHGNEYSGKLSCALELARGLTCQVEGAPWNCSCPSCRQQRLLIHPYTLMVGDRYFRDEIEACAAAYQRSGQVSTRFLFVRSVRKLLRRFDPVLVDEKDAPLKRVKTALGELEERILPFHPDAVAPEGAALEKEIGKITELAGKIQAGGGVDRIAIDQVRRIGAWSHETSESHKVVIFENADKMNDSARNALLKTLEEPPPQTTFMLLTSRKGGIMPTILSRVRPYAFAPRSEEVSREVLSRIFKEESREYPTLRDYFLAWNVNLEGIRRGAHRFLEGLKNGDALDRENLEALFPSGGGEHRKTFRVFLQEVTASLEAQYPYDKLLEKPGRAERFAQWNDLFRQALTGSESYNQSPPLLLEGLYYAMRGDR